MSSPWSQPLHSSWNTASKRSHQFRLNFERGSVTVNIITIKTPQETWGKYLQGQVRRPLWDKESHKLEQKQTARWHDVVKRYRRLSGLYLSAWVCIIIQVCKTWANTKASELLGQGNYSCNKEQHCSRRLLSYLLHGELKGLALVAIEICRSAQERPTDPD